MEFYHILLASRISFVFLGYIMDEIIVLLCKGVNEAK
jgi:hypothetical protein